MAQVGRISGPVLFANLERNGKNLDFRNQPSSTPVLKLDVNNNYVGINTTSPTFALDIGGASTLGLSDVKLTSFTPGNFTISNNDISVFSGNLNFVNPVVQSENRTLQTRLTQNRIDTYVSDASLHLLPNGTGTIELLTDTNIDGTLHSTGNITLDGNITLGDSTAEDTVTFRADINADVLPDAHYTYDIGTNKRVYNNIWTHLINGIIATSDSLVVNNIEISSIVGNIFWVSPNGNDNNKGDHPQSPWRTIRHALSAVDSSLGGPVVIHIESGEYEETLPLTVPEQVSIYGEDMRNTIVRPDSASQSEDVFLLNDASTIQNITIKDFYYDSGNDKGYAFRFAPNATINTRSPYVFNTTVITKGSTTSASDPRGYDSLDAGRAILCDGAEVDSNSVNASMLFYSLTLITPGTTSVTATNGVRIEWLNSFIYFAKEGIRVENGSTGRLSQDGSTVDYGGEIRCINSANIYGEKGIVADGSDALVYIIEHTFSYAGTGKRSDNDTSFVTDKFETTELNNGKILGTFIDKDGDFNVGDTLYVNQTTGDVEFKSVDFDFSDIAALTINTDGSVVTIDGTKVQTDLIRFRNNIVESTAGPLNFTTADRDTRINDNVTINADLDITGDFTIGGALVRLGDADTDSIDFNAEINNSLTPNINETYNLGTSSKYWRWLYSAILNTEDIIFETNKIRTKNSDSDLEFVASGTGKVVLSNLKATQNVTVSGTTTFNDSVEIQDQGLTVVGNITVSGDSILENVTVDTITANTNVSLDDVHFLGNRITTQNTNSNLELVPAGTGILNIPGDLEVTNRLLAPNANYSLVDATMNETSASHLVVNNQLIINGISINESFAISGNLIETTITNSDVELRANGTGSVAIQENLQVDNNFDVETDTTFDTVTSNEINTSYLTTDSVTVPSFDFDNIELTGNFITTTVTNSDLELRANGTGDVIVGEDVVASKNFIVNTDTTVNTTTAKTFTANNLTVNTNITMPSNMSVEGIDFIGNSISSNQTNNDLDLRASGTGNVIFGEDVLIENDLTVNGVTTFTAIASATTTPSNLIVNTINAFGAEFEDVAIVGNRIFTTTSNSNLELGASGTGVVRFKEQVQIQNLTVNDTLSVNGITVNADVEFNQIETSSNILFDDNYVTTSESNSDLELRANATGSVLLDDFKFQGSTLYGDKLDSTQSTIEIVANKVIADSNDSIVLPVGTVILNEDSSVSSDMRYDTSINQFVGKRGGFQGVFGGVYSNNLQTRIRFDNLNNAIHFDIDGTSVIEMNSIGETYADRIELSEIDIDNNVIKTNNTNGDIILLPEAGSGRIKIEDIDVLDRTIYTTGANIGVLAATDKGYVKFNQTNGLIIPIGTSAEREPNPEIGTTRFNIDLAYMENYTALGWATAAGTGQGISTEQMDELMNEYILIFG